MEITSIEEARSMAENLGATFMAARIRLINWGESAQPTKLWF